MNDMTPAETGTELALPAQTDLIDGKVPHTQVML